MTFDALIKDTIMSFQHRISFYPDISPAACRVLDAVCCVPAGAPNHAFLFSYSVSLAKFCCVRSDLAVMELREAATACTDIICSLTSRTLRSLSQTSGLAASRAVLAPVLAVLARLCIGAASALAGVRSSLLQMLQAYSNDTSAGPDAYALAMLLPAGVIWAGSSTSMLLHHLSWAAAAWGDLSKQQHEPASFSSFAQEQASPLQPPPPQQEQAPQQQQQQHQQQAGGAPSVLAVASRSGMHSYYQQLGNLTHVLAAAANAPASNRHSSSNSSSSDDALPVQDQQQQRRGWLLDDVLSLCSQCSDGLDVAMQGVSAARSSSSSKDSVAAAGSLPARQSSEQQQALAAILQQLRPLLDGVLPQLQQQLVAIGVEVCDAVPLPWLCNNPHCVNLECGSELMLVGGKGSVCGGCRVAR
jgi:hypothetical protein